MNRGQLPARLLPTRHHGGGDGPERMSGRTTICRNTPSNIMPPTRSQPGSSAEVSLGVRGHTLTPDHAHAPPNTLRSHPDDETPEPPLDTRAGTSKRSRRATGREPGKSAARGRHSHDRSHEPAITSRGQRRLAVYPGMELRL